MAGIQASHGDVGEVFTFSSPASPRRRKLSQLNRARHTSSLHIRQDHETEPDTRSQTFAGPAPVCPHDLSPGWNHTATSDYHRRCCCLSWNHEGPEAPSSSAVPGNGGHLAGAGSSTEWNADLVLYRLQPLPLQHSLLAGQWFLHRTPPRSAEGGRHQAGAPGRTHPAAEGPRTRGAEPHSAQHQLLLCFCGS